VLERFAETRPGAVKEVVKDFPLSSRCNFSATTELHQAACEAAVFVRLARERDREQEAVDWLFSQPNQQGVTVAEVRAAAETLFGVTDFDAAYARLIPDVQRDIADARAVGVGSTPTYFINGIRAHPSAGWLPAPYFELAITLELEASEPQRDLPDLSR
jgi:protein-disulfide isomerase